MKKTSRNIITAVFAAISYAAIHFLLRYGLGFLPDIRPWEGFEYSIGNTNYGLIDIIYFIFGLVLFVHGVIRLFGISKQNHKAQDMETRKPEFLLTDGYYSKVRHPMYGTFMLIQTGLLISLRSGIGIVLAVIIVAAQYFNGIIEENNQLIKIFGTEYEEYMSRVTNRYLTPCMRLYFIFASILTVSGYVFGIL